MESPEAQGEVINLGNPDERTIRSLAAVILAVTGRELPMVERPTAVGDDPNRRCPDIAKARALTGWEPAILLDDGLRRTIPYFERALRQDRRTGDAAGLAGDERASLCPDRTAA
jgi:UDP-glucuronate decarboxylase